MGGIAAGNDVAPVPSGVTQWPFPVADFGINVFSLLGLAFLIDKDAVITVGAETHVEAAALVNLDKKRIEAAALGLPFP